jgi:hypothetical protein
MVTPIGGTPHQPHVPTTPSPVSSWNQEINTILDELSMGEGNRAQGHIQQLIDSIQLYQPQTPQLGEAVTFLQEAQNRILNGLPGVSDILYSAQNCL